jgi:hypothetical protein
VCTHAVNLERVKEQVSRGLRVLSHVAADAPELSGLAAAAVVCVWMMGTSAVNAYAKTVSRRTNHVALVTGEHKAHWPR